MFYQIDETSYGARFVLLRESENSELLANDETASARLSLNSGSGEGIFFSMQRKHSAAAVNGNMDMPDLEPGESTYDGEVEQSCGDFEQSSTHLIDEQQVCINFHFYFYVPSSMFML